METTFRDKSCSPTVAFDPVEAFCEMKDEIPNNSHRFNRMSFYGRHLLFPSELRRILSIRVCRMMVGAALLFNVPSRAEADNKRSFTIKDSIEISYIISVARRTDISLQTEHPIGIPVKSADGKYFLLVTQRGVLPNNTLEGTIWLFNRQAIWDYASGRNTTKPLPRKLVTMAATSNTPVIYDVRWVDGSKKVAFLGKNGTPYQRLFVVDIETGSTEAVTKKDLYVTAYDMSGDTIVYTVLSQGLGFHFDTDLVVVSRLSMRLLNSGSNINHYTKNGD